jgi:hypothetical protein
MSGPRGRHARPRMIVGAALAFAITLAGQPITATAASAATGKADVSSELLASLAKQGTTDFFVYLKDHADLAPAARIADDDARAAKVFTSLRDTAAKSQTGLRALLDKGKTSYQSYWISNVVRVTGDRELLNTIAARTDVERVEPVRTTSVAEPDAKGQDAQNAVANAKEAKAAKARSKSGVTAAEWSLNAIEAPRVWDEFGDRGEGIVVANIDTGVDITHPALTAKYRGTKPDGTFDHNYNWFDPAGVCSTDAPCDNHGHGTHTAGTMVGDDGAGNQIGVAPGAEFIAAKGCESGSCSDTSLLAAGQWILAPTDLNGANPRPDLHPDVVNNSWGGGRGDQWYRDTVQAWVAAGIFPSVSAGNNGRSGCNTTEDPGDYPESYGVGAFQQGGLVSDFSGRGTSSIDNGVKPNISAPGSAIRSSVPGGTYEAWNGTSMAAPHVAGSVALLWAAAPTLRGDIAGTRAALDGSAVDVDDTSCGGTAANNNVYGEGRLDIYEAVVDAPRGPIARVNGTVTDESTGKPVSDVTVASDGRTVSTGADGRYQLTFEAGTHEVTAGKYGYVAETTTVTVAESEVVTVDFALAPAAMIAVSGTVTDGSGHGWPLYAKVEVAGRPGEPVFTDPVTGAYEFDVPAGATYAVTATAVYPGYKPTTANVAVGTAPVTANVAVPVDAGCTAAGYAGSLTAPIVTEAFDAGIPAGWTINNRTTGGGWSFTDTGGRGNLTGGSGGFAIVDSDKLGSGVSQNTELVSAPLDLSGQSAPVLRFNSDYNHLGSTASVDVSADGGTTWTTAWTLTASKRGPSTVDVPISAVAGVSGALVRFRYTGSYAWWWEVDNVQVLNLNCAPVPGGLVVGNTTDSNTGAPLNGVTVTSAGKPADKGTSAATAADDGVADGFYWLFSSLTGAHDFTATKAPYQSTTKSVTVPANGVAEANFGLAAGQIKVSTTAIKSYVTHGQTRSTNVTVTNTGNAPAKVETLEKPGSSEVLSAKGTPGRFVAVKGLTTAMIGKDYSATDPKAGTAAADAWTPIANYPVAVFDNSAVTVNGKVYSVGGGSTTGNENKAFVYDPEQGTWTALPNLPTARAKAQVATVDGKIYAFGGWSSGGTPVTTVDVFDTAAGTWSTLAAQNAKARAAAGVGVIGDKVYLIGGCTNGNCAASSDTVVFDATTGTFTDGTAYPHLVSWTGCGAIGEKLYCNGGATAPRPTTRTPRCTTPAPAPGPPGPTRRWTSSPAR